MFTKAVVRTPAANFAAGLTTSKLGLPDYQLALQQHDAYCEALAQCGLQLIKLPADENFPDSTFVEDTAVVVTSRENEKTQVVLTRPGASSRTGEVASIASALEPFQFETQLIQPPGTLDGGDVCEAGGHFFIGISNRTNRSGAEQLATLLSSWNYSFSFVDIRQRESLLHLKSGLAYLGNYRLAVVAALFDHPAFADFELVRVEPAEEYAANCVGINDHILIPAGYCHLQKSLHKFGYQTVALEMSEFQKMDGGLSCLSLRF
jgi:dimethylargininase